MSLLTTSERIPDSAVYVADADLASAEAMADQAIRLAEALMWAIYCGDEAAPVSAICSIAADHAGPRPRPQS